MNAKLKKAVLAAAIMSMPLAASAEDLIGGGATLPAIAYVGDAFVSTTPGIPDSRLSSSFLTSSGFDDMLNPYEYSGLSGSSIFAAFENNTNHRASYCQTGSSTGKRVLLGATGWLATEDCKDYSASPEGFSGPNALADFAGSDAPLNADDIGTFQNGHQPDRDNLVQIPALGAFIALPTNASFAGTRPDLSTDDVCGIYAAIHDSWDDINGSWPTDAIEVVVRSDGSGTTFAFTQYLAATCNGRTVSGETIASDFFQTEELYTDAVPSMSIYNGRDNLVSGNGGIITTVEATTASIGYANYSNVVSEGLDYATVDSFDPEFDNNIVVGGGDILIDTVLGANGSDGLPSTEDLFDVAPSLEAGCLAVVDPAVQLDQVYPIVAFTNLLGYTNYETQADADAVQALFTEVTAGTSTPAVGYSRVASQDVQDIIADCIDSDA